jgi:hypothetical protein
MTLDEEGRGGVPRTPPYAGVLGPRTARDNGAPVFRRILVAVACAALLAAFGVTGCSDDGGSGGGGGGGGKSASTTQPDDSPTQGPQSGTNPAGDEPVPGSAPAS